MKFQNFKPGKTLSLASALFLDAPSLAREIKEGEFIYVSPLEDKILGAKNLIRCEIGSISYVLALLCKYKQGGNGEFEEYFAELDDGFLSGECNVGEEEAAELASWAADARNVVIDASFFSHPDAKTIFRLLEILGLPVVVANADASENFSDFSAEGRGEPNEPRELENFDGAVLYLYRENLSEREQNSPQTGEVTGGAQFAAAAKLKDGDIATFKARDFSLTAEFRLDSALKGTVALAALNEDARNLGYNFKLVSAVKK